LNAIAGVEVLRTARVAGGWFAWLAAGTVPGLGLDQGGVEMPQCPICKSEAEEDGAGFSCKRHGEFRVADSVFKESKERTRRQWENALTLAERRAALVTHPLITTYDF
jgi:hypothetical protein